MRYWIDMTELLGTGAHSGIQRVTREISSRLLNGETQISADCVDTVVAIDGRFHSLNAAGREAVNGRQAPPAGSATSGAKALMKRLISRFPAFYGRLRNRAFNSNLRVRAASLIEDKPAQIGSGDVVLLLDTYWNGGTAVEATRRAKNAGAIVILVVYDLIPLLHPHVTVPQLRSDFARAIRRVLPLADAVLTISQAVTRDVLAYSGNRLAADRFRHFYLGHDFARDCGNESIVSGSEWASRVPGGEPTFVIVGTIEPRKRHEVALTAFDLLWGKGVEAKLVIIGRAGWLVDDFLERCRTHSRLGRQLFLIHDAPDALVQDAMAHADAAIMASTLEGFGLPVVEALSANLPVIASDIPVFREIAGDAALFFRADDPESLAEAVQAFLADPQPFRMAALDYEWLTWRQSAMDLAEGLTDLVDRCSRPG